MYLTKKSARLEKDKIIVMISGWGVPKWIFRFIKNSFPKNWGYLEYHYDKYAICSEPSKFKDKFLNIVETMKSDLVELNKLKKRKFYVYTLSLGSFFGLVLADYIKVEKMAMVVPIYDITETFWKRNKKDTQNVRSFFQRKGFGLAELRKHWSELSLKNALNKHSLRTKFLLRLSRDDVYLPAKIKRKLLLLLEKKNIKFISEQKVLPHKVAGMIDVVFPHRIIKFFLS